MSLKEKNQKVNITKKQINTSKQQRTFVPRTKWNWDFDMDLQRVEVKDSPFTLVRHENGIFIAMGIYKISETFTVGQENELLKEWETPKWDSIMRVVGVLIEVNEENNNLNN